LQAQIITPTLVVLTVVVAVIVSGDAMVRHEAITGLRVLMEVAVVTVLEDVWALPQVVGKKSLPRLLAKHDLGAFNFKICNI
jgi:hypothetical protein